MHSHLHVAWIENQRIRETNPYFYFMHLFTFVRLPFSTGRQQSQVICLFAVPQLSCVRLMRHFLLVTCLCHLQNSHTSLDPYDWVGGGFFSDFFPLAESFEFTGRKFCKPALLLLRFSARRSDLRDVDIIIVAVCPQKPTFHCAEKSQTLQKPMRMTQWISSTLLWSLINPEDFMCAWLCRQTENYYSFFTCVNLRKNVILKSEDSCCNNNILLI